MAHNSIISPRPKTKAPVAQINKSPVVRKSKISMTILSIKPNAWKDGAFFALSVKTREMVSFAETQAIRKKSARIGILQSGGVIISE